MRLEPWYSNQALNEQVRIGAINGGIKTVHHQFATKSSRLVSRSAHSGQPLGARAPITRIRGALWVFFLYLRLFFSFYSLSSFLANFCDPSGVPLRNLGVPFRNLVIPFRNLRVPFLNLGVPSRTVTSMFLFVTSVFLFVNWVFLSVTSAFLHVL